MATDKVDLSLDDIIKLQKKTRGGGRGRGSRRGGSATVAAGGSGRGFAGKLRGSNRGSRFGSRGGSVGGVVRGGVQGRRGVRQPAFTRGQIEGKWQHDLFRSEVYKAAGAVATRDNSRQGKLLISNLEFGVNDSDIQELFTEFGPLRKAAVHYDRSGRSLGTAEVIFEMKADAVKALQQYNNVPLDGRPMKIQLVGDSLAQTSPRPVSSGRVPNRPGNVRQGNQGSVGRGRGRGRGGRGGRGRGGAGRSDLTKEQLDAQLDAYKMDIN